MRDVTMTPDVAPPHVLESDQGLDVGLLGRPDPGVDLAALRRMTQYGVVGHDEASDARMERLEMGVREHRGALVADSILPRGRRGGRERHRTHRRDGQDPYA